MRPMLDAISAATTLSFTENEFALNQNSITIDFTMTNSYTVTLPPIEDLLAQTQGGASFEIRGSLHGAGVLRLQAGVDAAGATDRICSETHQFLSGTLTCFILKVCGAKDWGMFECGTLDS